MSDRAERIADQREREVARVQSGRAGTIHHTINCAVVGVTFVPTYPDNLLALEAANADAEVRGERLAVVIKRNPANPHDANACEVHVPALGDNGMIGHLPRAIAARLAGELDAGAQWKAEVAWVRIDPDHMDRPGIDIHLKRMDTPTNG